MNQNRLSKPLLMLPLIAGTLLMTLVAFLFLLVGAAVLFIAAITRRFGLGTAAPATADARVLDATYEVVDSKPTPMLVRPADPH